MRKKFRDIIIILFFFTVIFSSNIYAENIEDESNYSKKYEEWLALPEEEKKDTIAPLPFNIRKEKSSVIKRFKNLLKTGLLPERYDLREHIDIEVKNQMNTGECWAFSANSSIETNLAIENENYNFSERHIEYETSNSFNDGINPMALNRESGDGGYSSTAFTYYSRGNGPVLEEDMPFENNELNISINDLPVNSSVKKVDNMVYFPNIYKYKDENGNLIYTDADYNEYDYSDVLEIRSQIKEHIINHGGITISICAPFWFYNPDTCSDNNCWFSGSDHAVTIIGWDDNYDKTNFWLEPSENGAYIVLNSWGEEWGDNGVYYISYEDFLVESQMRGVTGVSDIEYDNIYQYDISEMYDVLETKYGANVFTAKSNEKLTEVMIGTFYEELCNVYIINGDNDLNINNAQKIANNINLKPGYNTVKLDNPIDLISGDKFYIIVEILNENNIGIGVDKNLEETFSNSISNSNESFISNDGSLWTDIYDENNMMNLSIKAFTQKNQKEMSVTDISGFGIEDLRGKYSLTVSTSYLEKNKDIDITIFKDNKDVTNNFNIKGNKIRGKGCFIKIEYKSEMNAGEYIVKISLDGYDDIYKSFIINEKDGLLTTASFKDENFYNYVKDVMKDSICDDNRLTISDTSDVFKSIIEMPDAWGMNITDISGIESFVNLESVDFLGNIITDFSPLGNLYNLNHLCLEGNFIYDLDFLENLKSLEYLDLRDSAPEEKIDISNIFKLTNLKELTLSGWTWITEEDLQDIYKLSNLSELMLFDCSIINLNFLKPLQLDSLYLMSDSINDLSGIKNMISLNRLGISFLELIDNLDYLENLINLKTFYLQQCNLRDASVLDNDVFKNNDWDYLSLSENPIDDEIEINRNEEKIIEVPKIIEQVCDENSLLYSPDGVELTNCEWEEYGKSIKVNSNDDISYCEIYVNSGYASDSSWNITLKVKDKDNDNDIVINFSDDNFGKLIYDILEDEDSIIDYDNKTITTKESKVNNIKDLLILPENEITNITGIESLVNLETISCIENRITDLSPLSSLDRLKEIYLDYDEIENINIDLSPLSNLDNLQCLYLNNCLCENISSISNLVNLINLSLKESIVDDLDFLENLENLEYLNLGYSALEEKIDISNIFKLTNLKGLTLSDWTWITEEDLQDIYKLSNLSELILCDCSLVNLDFLKTLQLDYLIVENCKLRDASVLDNDVFKNNNWDYLSLYCNYIDDEIEINRNEEKIIEVPKIIEQVCDENSLLYSPDGVELTNCEWEEYGKNIKINTNTNDDIIYCEIYINSGYAEYSSWNINLKVKDNEDIVINDIDVIEINNQKYITNLTTENNILKEVFNISNIPNTFRIEAKDIFNNVLQDEDRIGTGTVIEIYDENGEVIDSYVISILGDLDGNGIIDMYDPVRLVELVMDTGEDYIWDEALKIAGNCDKIEDNNNNSNPDIYDILRLIEYYFDNKVW